MAPSKLRSPYKSRSGKAWMRTSWVIYMDILGFSTRIKQATEGGTATELLTELTTALDEAKRQIMLEAGDDSRLGSGEAPYAVKMFTDNVVLGIPIMDDGESELGRIIYLIGLWQYTLLKHGFFTRGGVAVGPIYMDGDVAFGNGLLDAHEAESKLARDPRIVLAPSAVKRVEHHLAYYSEVEGAPHNSSLLIDADSQMFVNYLFFPIDGAEGLPSEFVADVQHHRSLVIDNLTKYSANPGIWSKYAWVGAYHNYFCGHYPGLAHLKIDRKLLAQAPRRLRQLYKLKGKKVLRDGNEVASKKFDWKVEPEPD